MREHDVPYLLVFGLRSAGRRCGEDERRHTIQRAKRPSTIWAIAIFHSPIRSKCFHWRKSPLKPKLSATRNVEITQRSICLLPFPARWQTDRSIRCLPYPYEGCGPRYADYEHQTSTLRLPKYRFTRIAGELRSLGANTTCGGDTVTNPSCGSRGSGGSCDDSRAP
jgi:hypothetical protein